METPGDIKHVLKELNRIQSFLIDTFGSKFREYKCKEKDAEDDVISLIDEDVENDYDEAGTFPIVTSTKSLHESKEAYRTATTSGEEASRLSLYELIESSSPSESLPPPPKPNFNYASKDKSYNVLGRTLFKRGYAPPIPAKKNSIHQNSGQSTNKIGTNQNGSRFGFSSSPSTSSNNDSVPVPIGLETVDDVPRPKRARLPSFKNPFLGLGSSGTGVSSLGTTALAKTFSVPKPKSKKPRSKSNDDKDNENAVIQCELCNLFIYGHQLSTHMMNHSLVTGRAGTSPSEQSSNMNKSQVCPICSEECINYAAYEQHCLQVHPEGDFPCPVCSRKMATKVKLKRHMIIHENLKYECIICGKAYNRSDNLTAHYRTHNADEEVSVFYCGTCSMAFSSRNGRDRHVQESHPGKLKSSSTLAFSESNNSTTTEEIDQRNQSSSSSSAVLNSEESSSNISDSITTTSMEAIKVEVPSTLSTEFVYEGDDDTGDYL